MTATKTVNPMNFVPTFRLLDMDPPYAGIYERLATQVFIDVDSAMQGFSANPDFCYRQDGGLLNEQQRTTTGLRRRMRRHQQILRAGATNGPAPLISCLDNCRFKCFIHNPFLKARSTVNYLHFPPSSKHF
jgi:hypothetical protein